jgi:putative oxidoreductase
MVAVLHGWHKVAGGLQYAQLGSHWPLLDDTVAMGFPAPVLFTAVAAAIQLLGGLMLALGLCTRIVALLVASTLATALVFNLQTGGPDAQLAGLYALVTGAFVLIGGGRWSLDRRVSGANDRGRYK